MSTGISRDDLDVQCMEIIDSNINMMVPWYIMASYAYYVEDKPILSDAMFDRMSRRMLSKWDQIEHLHKHHISVSDLEAGTFLGEYPSRAEGAVAELRSIYHV